MGRASGRGRPAGVVAVLLSSAALAGMAAAASIERITASGDVGPAGLPQSQVLAPAEGPAGEVVFLSRLTGVFRRATAGVALVLGVGATVPDGEIASVGDATLDDASCAVVTAALVGGAEGIYRACPGGVTRVVAAGDVTAGGRTIRRIDFGGVVAAAGFVGFAARLDDGADAVLRADGAAVVEIARPGAPSPAGGTLGTLRVAGIRPDGTVGVRAAVSGGRDGLFAGDGGGLATALVEGASTLVGRLGAIEQATLSRGGVWAFLGALEDGRAGVFRFDGTQVLPLVEPLLLTNDPIPTRPGTSVRDFPNSLVPSVSSAGDVAFRAVLGGSGSGAALFATRGSPTPQLVFSTRDATDLGLLSRLGDPRLADDGSLLFAATPVRGGTGVFVHRGGLVSPLALYGDPTDLERPDLRFRFVGGRVRSTAEGGLVFGEHDTLVRAAGGVLEPLVAVGAPSPIGGQLSEIGAALVDTRGRVFFRGSVADASRGEGIFVATEGGIVDRVVTNDRVAGGPLRDVVETAVELGGDLAGSQRLVSFAGLVGAGGGAGGLYVLRGRRARRLERTGRRLRNVGEIVAFDGRPALVSRRRYAFAAAVRDQATRAAVVVRQGRRRRVAAREGPSPDPRLGGRLVGFTIPDATTAAVVFRATSEQGGAQALFVDDWSTARLALATGEPDDAGRVLRAFERPVLAGADVVVAATAEEGGVLSEGLVRFAAAAVATGDDVVPESLIRTGAALPGGGVLHDVLSVHGTLRGAVLARVAGRDGPGRQMLLRVTMDANLDPPQSSQ